jgi:hypothetical protein
VIPVRKLAAQGLAQRLAPLGIALALGACAATLPPGPPIAVLPGTGKDLAAFQQDELICQQHAVAHTGYGSPAGSAATGRPESAENGASLNATAGAAPVAAGTTAANATVPVGAQPFDEAGYQQCMASRGDIVQPQPAGYAAAAYRYGYLYPYPYDYPFG